MTQWNIQNIVDELQEARNEWRTQRKSLKDFGGGNYRQKTKLRRL